jgi:hypothetical protein
MSTGKPDENSPDRVRPDSEINTEDTNGNDDRINRDQQDSNLTTADLARSAEAESEERRQTRDARRTDIGATRGTTVTRGLAMGAGAATAATPAREGEYARLFSEGDAKDFRARWESLQVSFVDEPRRAVEQADSLVAEAIKRLAEVFAEERQKLERQWDRGDNVSTEDLRVALQHYRAFFGRLLSV